MATVKMVRDGEPNTADVHPDEVANYAAGGWSVAEQIEMAPEDAPVTEPKRKARGRAVSNID